MWALVPLLQFYSCPCNAVWLWHTLWGELDEAAQQKLLNSSISNVFCSSWDFPHSFTTQIHGRCNRSYLTHQYSSVTGWSAVTTNLCILSKFLTVHYRTMIIQETLNPCWKKVRWLPSAVSIDNDQCIIIWFLLSLVTCHHPPQLFFRIQSVFKTLFTFCLPVPF